ncbi:DUF4253 domain-containing protein [Kineococcus rhizosphaerae]|uniref:Uncharacterized protein DUF4253 n=1 Tax=Kineococcus rhizosphaerae TaxID=559628 RepID=A0A2T0R690_9ACTN|nr:DUF4253 domain-containing protein [Kineococcus rhizosphaerae]PRY16676.1 uncharacterized protein DUF4253 [Kineococcus rhizosphaerae]
MARHPRPALPDLVDDVPGLPPGRLVAPVGVPGAGPVVWVSAAPAARDDWGRLARLHPATGLWPVLLEGLEVGDVERPWTVGEFSGPDDVVPLDVETFLAGEYAAALEDEDDWEDEDDGEEPPTGPPPAWPGLSPALPAVTDPLAAAERFACELLDHGPHRHLGLVAVDRGADVLAAIGWYGAVNSDVAPATLSAVLRSWEDRFSTRLVALGFDTVRLSVAAPPTSLEAAVPVAAEHLAFCCDEIVQNGPGDVVGHAEQLVGAGAWRFWWD